MKYLYVYLVFIPQIIGCSTSTLIHSWKNTTSTKKYSKILVVALSNFSDINLRENMENHLVEDLNESGVKAISSINRYGPKTFENKSEETILNSLQKDGIDAVLTIVLLNKEKERYYTPSRVYYSPYIIYQRRFWGYYTTIYDRIYEPGYYSESTNYFWESNLYDIENKELIYSAQSKSFNPASINKLADEYGKIIKKDLIKMQAL